MPPKKKTANDQVEELLAKILATNLWAAGANQATIKRSVEKSSTWVNDLLKGVPKPTK